eukprot:CAMPEP_0181133248 /NCGR_PEP_ID=MMETSP1071-20121207/31428_1 /TAXON_ID=35127 /ORGANISM="Thalassiosira sp., Strain NH16" /LENGTH=487 /DNA_ID=CAMNT_0023219637 /DNA_START=36 /DNA_END=1500 /DNA_ORIENTATION=+
MMLPLPTPTPSPGATTFVKNLRVAHGTPTTLQVGLAPFNLKRREAGLPMLNETDFTLRLEAAVALRKEREGREERSGVDHRKDKSKKKHDKKRGNNKQQGKDNRRKPAFAKNRDDERGSEVMNDDEHVEDEEEKGDATMLSEENDEHSDADTMDEEPPEINPSQSLFDNHISSSPAANLSYMQSKFSFYLPDIEYCTDLEGLLGYCNEKVRWGNICLCCQKTFKSAEAVLKHMRDKRHCNILYERGVDQEEFDVFYDFSRANKEFLGGTKAGTQGNDEVMAVDVDGEDEGEWEDVEEEEDDVYMREGEDDDLYDAYQEELATHGFDITPLGELILPDGRIIGHRGLARYYKQRFAPDRMERAPVRHARDAAGDRLYAGRVVNLYRMYDGREHEDDTATGGSTAMATMGRMAGSIPTGRNGKGILVSGEGKGGFTSLSLYRYRAAVKKQRKEDARGQRLQLRSRMNMNRMDKKANNKMTGVCTALAPR